MTLVRTSVRSSPYHLALGAVLVAGMSLSSCAHQPKVRIVTLMLQASEGTNEGRPMTIVVQENATYSAGPPNYEEVVNAASQGKPLLAKATVYPGHETAIKLVDLAIDTQILVSALYTVPPDHWQEVVSLGKRQKVSLHLGMRGIE